MARDAVARGHRSFSHTADVGIEGWGPDLASAFEEAGEALEELMVDRDSVEEKIARRIELSAADLDDLLVRWLNELVFLVDAEALVFHRFSVGNIAGAALSATAYGERLDVEKHGVRTAVKAATYHGLAVSAGPPARLRAIVDL